MSNCPHCNQQLSAAESVGGRCQHCGKIFSRDLGSIDRMESDDAKMMSASGGQSVSARTNTTAIHAASPESVDSGVNWSTQTLFTRESDLPEPMRTIIVEDQTIATFEEDLPLLGGMPPQSGLTPRTVEIPDSMIGAGRKRTYTRTQQSDAGRTDSEHC